MKNEIQKLISELEARKKSHTSAWICAETPTQGDVSLALESECDFFIDKLKLLLNEQPEAITDDAQFRKHDVGRSAACDDSTNIGDHGAASSETQAVGQNEQTKKACIVCGEKRFFYFGEYFECYGGHKQYMPTAASAPDL